jgi:hypothetical protein
MWRDAQQPATFAARLQHEVQVTVLEVTHTTVHKSRGPARGPAGEIAALEQRDGETAQRRIAGNASARNPTAYNNDVEDAAARSRPRLFTPRRREVQL